jgi:hypothetical protein
MVFANATYNFLNTPNTKITCDGYYAEKPGNHKKYADYINNNFDVFVCPLANAFRTGRFIENLIALTELIECLKIPVLVPSVGADLDMLDNKLSKKYTIKFCKTVLDHSNYIGVRGEVTYDVLKKFGFNDKQVRITGCPSVFINGMPPKIVKEDITITKITPISLSISPYLYGLKNFLDYNLPKYKNLIYIPQNSADYRLLLYGISDNRWPQCHEFMPLDKNNPLYKNGQIKAFIDTPVWEEFLKTRKYAIGTRIHGTIMALLSGTPATLLTHRSRTDELSNYFNIPKFHYINDTKDKDINYFYQNSDWTKYNNSLPEKLQVINDFFWDNNLETIYSKSYSRVYSREQKQNNSSFDINKFAKPVNTVPNRSINNPNLLLAYKPDVQIKSNRTLFQKIQTHIKRRLL